MKHDRLHALSDGIFAVAMTVLVFSLTVPTIATPTNLSLWQALVNLAPAFTSMVLSFAVLLSYWRAHNFMVSTLAQNVDVSLTGYNAFFLFWIVLAPFSANFLAHYYNYEIAIVIMSCNIIVITIALMLMRDYILRAETIQNSPVSDLQLMTSNVRAIIPTVSAAAAILVGLFDTRIALLLLVVALLFNLTKYCESIAQFILKMKQNSR